MNDHNQVAIHSLNHTDVCVAIQSLNHVPDVCEKHIIIHMHAWCVLGLLEIWYKVETHRSQYKRKQRRFKSLKNSAIEHDDLQHCLA